MTTTNTKRQVGETVGWMEDGRGKYEIGLLVPAFGTVVEALPNGDVFVAREDRDDADSPTLIRAAWLLSAEELASLESSGDEDEDAEAALAVGAKRALALACGVAS